MAAFGDPIQDGDEGNDDDLCGICHEVLLAAGNPKIFPLRVCGNCGGGACHNDCARSWEQTCHQQHKYPTCVQCRHEYPTDSKYLVSMHLLPVEATESPESASNALLEEDQDLSDDSEDVVIEKDELYRQERDTAAEVEAIKAVLEKQTEARNVARNGTRERIEANAEEEKKKKRLKKEHDRCLSALHKIDSRTLEDLRRESGLSHDRFAKVQKIRNRYNEYMAEKDPQKKSELEAALFLVKGEDKRVLPQSRQNWTDREIEYVKRVYFKEMFEASAKIQRDAIQKRKRRDFFKENAKKEREESAKEKKRIAEANAAFQQGRDEVNKLKYELQQLRLQLQVAEANEDEKSGHQGEGISWSSVQEEAAERLVAVPIDQLGVIPASQSSPRRRSSSQTLHQVTWDSGAGRGAGGFAQRITLNFGGGLKKENQMSSSSTCKSRNNDLLNKTRVLGGAATGASSSTSHLQLAHKVSSSFTSSKLKDTRSAVAAGSPAATTTAQKTFNSATSISAAAGSSGANLGVPVSKALISSAVVGLNPTSTMKSVERIQNAELQEKGSAATRVAGGVQLGKQKGAGAKPGGKGRRKRAEKESDSDEDKRQAQRRRLDLGNNSAAALEKNRSEFAGRRAPRNEPTYARTQYN
ncbi:unnamed protein product [Amoebophrya sp. A25]|nr:unnamed protein product [Amoebophrya sp. A25]|eukprot:GSA25T00017541001.1